VGRGIEQRRVQKAFGTEPVDIEVVAHGKGLGMLVESRNGAVRERLTRIARSGVAFAACQNTMTREGVSHGQLAKVARVVDSGVAEVVRKQEARWAYVRSGS
jgi:intracellular sulfur oxidation DsrE/DsrF family protein